MVIMNNYNSIKAVNASLLKECLKSPMHGWQYLHGDRTDSGAMSLGRLVHSLVLEPESHDEKYFVIGKGERVEKYREQAGSKEIVREAQLLEAKLIAQSVLENESAIELLKDAKREVDLTFEVNGIPCKARIDAHTNDTLIELKTSNEIYARDFTSAIIRFDYALQMAFYREALKRNGIEIRRAVIIQATTDSPYLSNVYELDDDFLQYGDNRINKSFNIAADLLKGIKPAQDKKIKKLNFPSWAITE